MTKTSLHTINNVGKTLCWNEPMHGLWFDIIDKTEICFLS